jgi:hypothetical protein
MRCAYCGLESGQYDEHEACVDESAAEALSLERAEPERVDRGGESREVLIGERDPDAKLDGGGEIDIVPLGADAAGGVLADLLAGAAGRGQVVVAGIEVTEVAALVEEARNLATHLVLRHLGGARGLHEQNYSGVIASVKGCV